MANRFASPPAQMQLDAAGLDHEIVVRLRSVFWHAQRMVDFVDWFTAVTWDGQSSELADAVEAVLAEGLDVPSAWEELRELAGLPAQRASFTTNSETLRAPWVTAA